MNWLFDKFCSSLINVSVYWIYFKNFFEILDLKTFFKISIRVVTGYEVKSLKRIQNSQRATFGSGRSFFFFEILIRF